jgi:hypothetical protein
MIIYNVKQQSKNKTKRMIINKENRK